MSDPADKQKPEIADEGDEPLFVKEISSTIEPLSEKEMPSHKVDDIERSLKVARGVQTIILKGEGFWLLILCIALAAGTYIADCILINQGMKSSSLMTGFFELLKFIISILLGFVFAKSAES